MLSQAAGDLPGEGESLGVFLEEVRWQALCYEGTTTKEGGGDLGGKGR
jgi:hypothetical protein